MSLFSRGPGPAAIDPLKVLLPALLFAVSTALAAESPYEIIRNVTYAQRAIGAIQADIYQPAGNGPRPAVVLIHGGAWLAGNKNELAAVARFLAEHEYAVMAINYRLAPTHKFPAQLDDCRDAVRWVRAHGRQYNMDRDHIGIWGYSAGGHLAMLVGVTKPRVQAVVAGGAPCDFRPIDPDSRLLVFWLGQTRRDDPSVYNEASPAQFISSDDPPTFLYHGNTDEVVPVSQPTDMVKQLKAARVDAEMLVVAGGHVGAMKDKTAMQKALEFLDKHLKTSGVAAK